MVGPVLLRSARLPLRLSRAALTLPRAASSTFTTRTRSPAISTTALEPRVPLLRSPSYALPSSSAPLRALCTAPADDRVRLPPFADECLRGVGQVVFCNSPASGAMILGLGGRPVSRSTPPSARRQRRRRRGAGLDAGATSAGLFGYNGCLVGCAFSVFLGAPPVTTLAATVVGGGASAIVAAALKPAMGSVPQWTSRSTSPRSRLAYVRPLDGAAYGPADAGALELALAARRRLADLRGQLAVGGRGDARGDRPLLEGCAAHTLAGSCRRRRRRRRRRAGGRDRDGALGLQPGAHLARRVGLLRQHAAGARAVGRQRRPPCSSAARRRRSAPPPAAPPSRCRSAPSRAAATCSAAPRRPELAASPHSPEKNEGAKTTM